MKGNLGEQIRRMHTLAYKEDKVINESFIDDLLRKLKIGRKDEPNKADLVKGDVNDFYSTLENIKKSGGLSPQKKGSMVYQKEVETLQIGLTKLGYSLPRFGVDGLYGPETASAVRKFNSDNLGTNDVNATPQTIDALMGQLKKKNIKASDILQYTDKDIPSTNMSLGNKEKSKYAIDYLMKNGGFTLEQAAAIAGNLQVESGFNTNIEGDKNLSSSSFGIAQWRESRLENLKNFAKRKGKPWNDLNLQLSFVIHELNTTHKSVGDLIKSTNDINKLAEIVQSKYEVSTPSSLKNRQIYANLFYNDYTKNQDQKLA